MLYPEICLPGLFPSYRPILSLLGALFLCFLNEKICQRLLAPRVCSFLAVFTLNQLYFLWSLSYFPFTVWDTSNQPLLGWLLQVHTDFFFSFIISTPELFLICAEFEKKKKERKRASKNLNIRNDTHCCGDYQQNLKLHLFSKQPVIWYRADAYWRTHISQRCGSSCGRETGVLCLDWGRWLYGAASASCFGVVWWLEGPSQVQR